MLTKGQAVDISSSLHWGQDVTMRVEFMHALRRASKKSLSVDDEIVNCFQTEMSYSRFQSHIIISSCTFQSSADIKLWRRLRQFKQVDCDVAGVKRLLLVECSPCGAFPSDGGPCGCVHGVRSRLRRSGLRGESRGGSSQHVLLPAVAGGLLLRVSILEPCLIIFVA